MSADNSPMTFDVEFQWPEIDRLAVTREHQRRASAFMAKMDLDLLLVNEPDTIHALMGQPALKFYDILIATYFLVDRNFEGVAINPYNPVLRNPYDYPGLEGIKTALSVGANAFYPDLAVEHVVREIQERGARRVGVDRPLAEILLGVQQRLPDVEFVAAGWEMRKLREIKMPEEIAEFEIAARIAARGHALAMEAVETGVIDGQLSGIFAHYALAHGSMYPANLYNLHNINIESWGIKGTPLQETDTIVLDYGLYSKMGLQADMGRTVWAKGVDPNFRDKYVAYVEAMLSVCENEIKPGMTRQEVARSFSDAYRSQGLSGELFMLGHGAGFRISEQPVMDVTPVGLEWGEEDVIKEGQVICFEPAILEENHGRKAIMQAEDMWVVEARGLRKISTGCGYMGIDY